MPTRSHVALSLPAWVAVFLAGCGNGGAGGAPHGRGQCPLGMPLHVMIVHLEPNSERTPGALMNLVDLAGSHFIPLTLEFSPSWGSGSSSLLETTHGWQQSGHEMAAQHHGPSHPGTWDGYTGMTREEAEALRRALGKIPEPYLGDMDAFMTALLPLSPEVLIRAGAVINEDTDWPAALSYRTEGSLPSEAVSRPAQVTYNGDSVIEIRMGYLYRMDVDPPAPQAMPQFFEEAGEEDIFAAVTHDFDFFRDPGVIEDWFNFLSGQDPEMACARTVSELLDAW